MTEKKIYPYLGRNFIDGKPYVVLFNDVDQGMVVMNDTNNTELAVGTYDSFAEEVFEILPPNEFVRLSN